MHRSLDPDGSAVGVPLLYGVAMGAIQGLERELALLSVLANTSPTSNDSRPFEERFPALFKRYWQAFQKDAAGHALRKVRRELPEELRDELAEFFRTKRNTLAHRFFVERIEADEQGRPRFRRGSCLALMATYQEAERLSARVREVFVERSKDLPFGTGKPTPDQTQWAEDVLRLVTRRQLRPEPAPAFDISAQKS